MLHTFTWLALCLVCYSEGLKDLKCLDYNDNTAQYIHKSSSVQGLYTCAYKWTSNMCGYTRTFLLEQRRARSSTPTSALLQKINNLSLLKSHRSCRAGSRKQRKIPVIWSSCDSRRPKNGYRPSAANFSNLRPLPRCTEVIHRTCQLRFATVNTQSLGNKLNTLLEHTCHYKYDLLSMSETWIQEVNPHDKAQYNDLGFDIRIFPRKDRQGGGVGLIFKSHYSCELIEELTNTCESYEVATWLVRSAKFSLLLPVIYRPPSSSVTLFFEEFAEFVTHLSSYNHDYIISGDLNIHYNKDTPATVTYKDLLSSLDLCQHVHCPTHRSENTLDHILTCNSSKTELDLTEPIDDLILSDHSIISVQLSLVKDDILRKTTTYRPISKVNPENVRNGLLSIVSSLMENGTDPLESVVSQLNSDLTKLLDKLAPYKTKRLAVRTKHDWFSDEMSDLKREKRRLEKQWQNSKTQENWTLYKHCRNRYSMSLHEAKVQCYSSAVANCGKDARRLFNTVSGLLGVNKHCNPLPDSCNNTTLANDFADFFHKKICKIRSELDDFPEFSAPYRDCKTFSQFLPVSETWIMKHVKSTKPTTAAIDPCPSAWIKDNIDIVSPLLTRIVNTSFENNDFTSSWKKAVVIPLLKKSGLDLLLPNYRPVSNLTYISKIVERCVMDQFNAHLLEENLLPSYQSAYRPKYSTETALMKLHCHMLASMENRKITAFIGLDLSAAFDTVDHGILLNTLRNRYGVEGKALEWFASYLSERSFHTLVEGASSLDKSIDFSVPQGSILGPVLYSVYASPLEDVITRFETEVIGYADDHGIYKSFPPNPDSEKETLTILEQCLNSVHVWMCQNKLKLNPSKTEFIMFGGKSQLKKCSIDIISVSDACVKKSHSIKYLGVHLDESLTLKQQINAKSRAALFNLSRIRTIRKYLDVENTQTLVSCLVLSHIDYASTLYYGLPSCDINKLQRVQNMAAKLVLNRSKYDSSTDSLKTLHWLPVRERIKYKIAVYVFKCLNNLAPSYLSELLHIHDSQRQLRSSSRSGVILKIPFTQRSTFMDRSFTVAGPKIWNDLPAHLRSVTELDHFKSLLKTHLFKSYFN